MLPLHADHARTWRENRFVYPVLSRRSGGLSVGINLNPDKVCNFDCVYCQVDRRSEAETQFVATEQLLAELELTLDLIQSGAIYEDIKFGEVPAEFRRLNDIAFSGDGEPTTFRNFDLIATEVAGIKRRRGLDNVKLVLITNASMFHRPACLRALRVLDENQGEIWAKLDAGTEAYYHRIERTVIPFRQILDNIANVARERPVVIQSLFLRLDDVPPSSDEVAAFADRLVEIQSAGGMIRLVQIYTVARRPAEDFVSQLSMGELERIADIVHQRTLLRVAVFP
jgi:wyosine [tRNA(Phe)-imidazoG37] synthetase (radical SAM superfamily)